MSPVRSTGSAVALALAAALLPPPTRAQTDSTGYELPDPGPPKEAPQAGAPNSATAEGEATLRQAGLKSDGPALLEFFRNRTLSPAKLARLQGAVRRLGAPSFPDRERASGELAEAGRPAVPLLKGALADPDLEIARRAGRCLEGINRSPDASLALAAAQLLAVKRPAGAAEVLLDYLPFCDEPSVEEELLATLSVVAFDRGKADPALIRAAGGTSPAQRCAAARLLGRSRDASHQALVRRLLADPDQRVRWQAAEALLLARDSKAVPVLLTLLSEAPPDLAGQAEDALCRLAGEQAPQAGLGTATEEERKKCREAWERWWGTRGSKLDLAKLDLGRRVAGLPLVVALNGYGGRRGGRVWELGPDRKTRWEMRDVGGPFDAVVLPGRRLLVAEYEGRRVVEKDFRGKVLWRFDTGHGALCCQRLANGNTLVTTNYDIREVTRAGKVVFNFPHKGGNIFSAVRLDNGHVLYGTYDGWIAEMDRRGREVKRFRIPPPNQGLVTLEVLPGGRLLMCRTAQGRVVELDGAGKVVWQCAAELPTTAVRLPNGHTFIGSHSNNRILEVDRAGKVVWQERTEGQIFRVRVR